MREKNSPESVCPYCGYNPKTYSLFTYVLQPYTILHGRYLIGKALGAGGFGITYVAMDLVLEHKVAVKEFFVRGNMERDSTTSSDVFVSGNSDSAKHIYYLEKDKFEAEAKTLARLDKMPGIVDVRDFFPENGTSYIVLEYLEGITLKDYVRKKGGRLDYREVLEMLHPLIRSLIELHRLGILHRDISPDNIMVMDDGSVKLFDFGGVRFQHKNPEDPVSQLIMKKSGFSPIEQYTGSDQGGWTDEYALAATIYYCICGKVPPESISRASEKDTLKKPSEMGISIPADIEKAILKSLSVRREGRFGSIRSMEEALYGGGDGRRKRGKMIPAAAGTAAAVLLLAAAFALGSRVGNKPGNGKQDEAVKTAEDSQQNEAVKITGDSQQDEAVIITEDEHRSEAVIISEEEHPDGTGKTPAVSSETGSPPEVTDSEDEMDTDPFPESLLLQWESHPELVWLENPGVLYQIPDAASRSSFGEIGFTLNEAGDTIDLYIDGRKYKSYASDTRIGLFHSSGSGCLIVMNRTVTGYARIAGNRYDSGRQTGSRTAEIRRYADGKLVSASEPVGAYSNVEADYVDDDGILYLRSWPSDGMETFSFKNTRNIPFTLTERYRLNIENTDIVRASNYGEMEDQDDQSWYYAGEKALTLSTNSKEMNTSGPVLMPGQKIVLTRVYFSDYSDDDARTGDYIYKIRLADTGEEGWFKDGTDVLFTETYSAG